VQIDIGRFREAFFEEAVEHVANLEAGLLRLEAAPTDAETLNLIFRSAHSIKGSGGSFGLDGVARFTHAMESLLGRMREGTLVAGRAQVDLLLRATDALKSLLATEREGAPEPEAVEPLLAEMNAALGAAPAPASSATPAPAAPKDREWCVVFQPAPDLFRQGMDPLLLLRDVASLGELLESRCDATHLPDLDVLEPDTCHLAWTLRLSASCDEQAIRDVFAWVDDACRLEIRPVEAERAAGGARAAAGPAPSSAALESSTLRVPVDKVDKLINLVGEIVIAQSMIREVVQDFQPGRLAMLQEAVAQMERNTRELQERVMGVRMVPIGTLFGRFPRVVRDIATASGKQIRLVTAGEETELDKSVVERIGDPLTHMIRNAADHGIEPADERSRAGKPGEGTIRLSASTLGGSVVVDVEEDGRGLDTERIRAKAIERGLIPADGSRTADEIHALIFEPGFSTAQVVSDVSGRGVGMDVVRRNVEALNGTVSIHTEKGRGTRFRIKLPLTLAILDGLTISVGGRVLILPLLAVVESVRPRPEDVRSILARGEVVLVRGEPIPLVRLHRALGVPGALTDPSEAICVLVEHEGRHIALMADDLLGQQQVVIKSLDANYRRVEGVMGATILGDGTVALILDVGSFARRASKDNLRSTSTTSSVAVAV
jgi:two-component system chemotaxis sensor kinase CheA